MISFKSQCFSLTNTFPALAEIWIKYLFEAHTFLHSTKIRLVDHVTKAKCAKNPDKQQNNKGHMMSIKNSEKNFLILHFLSAKFHALLDLAGKKTPQKGLVLIYIMQNSASRFSLQQGYDILNHKEAFWIHEMMIKYFRKSIDKKVKRKWLP